MAVGMWGCFQWSKELGTLPVQTAVGEPHHFLAPQDGGGLGSNHLASSSLGSPKFSDNHRLPTVTPGPAARAPESYRDTASVLKVPVGRKHMRVSNTRPAVTRARGEKGKGEGAWGRREPEAPGGSWGVQIFREPECGLGGKGGKPSVGH